ncbi:MAG: FHA domain-containing protein [Planctomycetia bacterium]|nr:FHA domain-containing protein [Planctomycetia bacterium]
MRAKLIIVGGKANRAEVRLKLPVIVGRSRKAGIVIDHHTVSRQHCELFEENGEIFVRDLGSLNGTHVSGDQVQRALLEHGAELCIGPLTFRLVYNHLANTVAPSAAPTEDAVLPDAPADLPELAETVVNLPRIARPEPLEELVNASLPDAPLVDLGGDDGFDLDLPVDEEPIAAAAESIAESPEELDLLGSDDDSFDLDLESPLVAPEALDPAPISATKHDEIPAADDDELSFDLSPMPELEEIAPVVAAKTPAPPQAPLTSKPAESADDDDFLAMMTEETVVVERPAARPEAVEELAEVASLPKAEAEVPPSGAPDEDDFLAMMTEETIVMERPPAPPTEDAELSFDDPELLEATSSTASAVKTEDESELDWLDVEEPPQTAEPADVDLNELAANMPPAFSSAETQVIDEIDELEELAFDEPVAESAAPVPHVETTRPAKKKRGLWPFGRQKAAAVEIANDVVDELEPVAESPVAETSVAASSVTEMLGGKTVVMGNRNSEGAESTSPNDDSIVDISLTHEISHETTVVIDDAEWFADETPASPTEKPKRGLFGLKRKAKSAAALDAAQAEMPVPATQAVAEATGTATTKRGWWPFSKKGAAKSQKPVAEVAPTAAPAGSAPAATVGSPSPESFEFSDAELLEITAEGPPPASAARNPQELAADEVLDFELDLPLEETSGNIKPVLSDAPPPATGADDDDFLDFLAEELPSTKQKPRG